MQLELAANLVTALALTDRPGAAFDDEQHPAQGVGGAGLAVVAAHELHAGVLEGVIRVGGPGGVAGGLALQVGSVVDKESVEYLGAAASRGARALWLV